MITVSIYTNSTDPLKAEIEQNLKSLQDEIPHQVVVIDIDTDMVLQRLYGASIPIVKVGPYTLQKPITRERLAIALGASRDRNDQFDRLKDKKHAARYQRAREITRTDRLSGWIADHYIAVFNTFLVVYLLGAFLPAFFMAGGASLPARAIYAIYSPLCHQLAFRSWFLFGQQAYYPRELANLNGVLTYEEAVLHTSQVDETSEQFTWTARDFIGDAQLGYKVALCQRDVALYGGLLAFGFIFAAAKRKVRQIPWYVWVFLGLAPIALDGFSQFPGLIQGAPGWLPFRESTPLLRTITGALFGVMTAWYLYPMVEESMLETRTILAEKRQIIHQSEKAQSE